MISTPISSLPLAAEDNLISQPTDGSGTPTPPAICNNPGSLNSPSAVISSNLTPYIPTAVPMGTWDISTATDTCANNEFLTQQSYAAENLNINGAPLNIYKLLGVHEQGDGSLLNLGTVMASQSAPGYPVSNLDINQPWRSVQSGSTVAGTAFVGVDFGVKMAGPLGEQPSYAPVKPNWQEVGAVILKQGNTAFNYARQVRVDIADGKTEFGSVSYSGTGNGTLAPQSLGPQAVAGFVSIVATSATTFNVSVKPIVGAMRALGVAVVGQPFLSVFANFTISNGGVAFTIGDTFTFPINYVWKRAGVFNLGQSASPITLNLQTKLRVKAVRVVPTLFTGTDNWEVQQFDVLDSPPTDINNIQDLFFQENRDRDYSAAPITIKAQYSISDSLTDLSKFGLNILDQYSFTVSFAVMVNLIGRPIVTGDIIEVVPEMQYDHNLKPVRKFLEVTDTGWASAGFSSAWKPTLYRFQAQEAIPSQETRDIFGMMDTVKYLTADSILADGVGEQVDTSPLTTVEELMKEAADKVPERGSDDGITVEGVPLPLKTPTPNAKGQPTPVIPTAKPNSYIEDGLPKNGEPYGEGYALPDSSTAKDGDYFRLYYVESTKIPPTLYRFSAMKGRWVRLEVDRRIEYTSAKPSIHKILNSPTKQGLGKKV